MYANFQDSRTPGSTLEFRYVIEANASIIFLTWDLIRTLSIDYKKFSMTNFPLLYLGLPSFDSMFFVGIFLNCLQEFLSAFNLLPANKHFDLRSRLFVVALGQVGYLLL